MNRDRINELYEGKIFSPEIQRIARERIHWICRQARGGEILNIGCNNGIICFLLAREGFNCIGIDNEHAAIEYALKELEKEEEAVRKIVTFQYASAIQLPFEDNSFDTVIITEILEHLNHPKKVLKEAKRVLKDGGLAVITVPFGLNLSPDYKKTYYSVPFLETVEPFFKTDMIDTMPNYIIYRGIKDASYNISNIPKEDLLLEKLRLQRNAEERAQSKEQELFDKSNQVYDKMKKLNKQIPKLFKINKELNDALQIQKREFEAKLQIKEQEFRRALAKQTDLLKHSWSWRLGSVFIVTFIFVRDFIKHPLQFGKEARRSFRNAYCVHYPKSITEKKVDDNKDTLSNQCILDNYFFYKGKKIHLRNIDYSQYLPKLEKYIEKINRMPTEKSFVIMFSGTIYIQEEKGNRPIRLTKTFLESGIPIFFSYFRRKKSDLIPDNYHDLLFQSPIDFTLQSMDKIISESFGERTKIFVISFPYPEICRYINQLNLNGWITVYDARDDWEEFEKIGMARWYDKNVEKYIINACDAAMATSKTLQAKLQNYTTSKTILFCPNAYDKDFVKDKNISRKYKNNSNKIAGYFGHLTDKWFDWSSLKKVAKRMPEWDFEIIGHGEINRHSLPPNVKLLGKKGHSEINKIAARWDVAMIVFKINKLSQAVDPIKIYEYLALELPTVTFTMPQIHDYPYVYPCNSVEEFIKNLQLASEIEPKRKVIWSFLAKNRWEDRADYFLNLPKETGNQKNLIKKIYQL